MGAMGDPSALTLVAAAVGWMVVGVVPGWMVASALAPHRSVLDRLVVAPAIAIGLAYSAAAWCNRLGVDSALQAAIGALALASVASVVVLLRRRRSAAPAPLDRAASLRSIRIPLVIVVAMWVVAMATSVSGWGLVVPGSDGNSHGLLVVHILQSGDVLGRQGYPLGVHLVSALVGAMTSVPSALVVPLTLLGSVWLVMGVAALAGRVSAECMPWAALAACAVPYFPFGQVNWGPVPLVVAVALVPGVALAVLDAADRTGLLLGAVSVAGLIAIHVTEALVAAALVGLVVLARRRPILVPLRNGVVVAVGGLLLVAPLVGELVAGGASRPQEPSRGDGPIAALVSSLLQPFVPSGWADPVLFACSLLAASVLLAISVVGALRAWPHPYGRAVTLLIGVLMVLAVLARVTRGGLLTSPWYGDGDRLVAQSAALLPVLLGVGVARLLTRAREGGPARVVAAAVGLSAAFVVAQGVVAAQQGLGAFSVVTSADRLAFAWLAQHARPGELVLNDHRDGSVWMVEATSGTAQPLFGGKPGGGYEAYPEWADRLYLRDHVADIGTDPRVRATADEWQVRYVFSGERTFGDAPRLVDADALARTPGVVEVFRQGGVRVFQLPRA